MCGYKASLFSNSKKKVALHTVHACHCQGSCTWSKLNDILQLPEGLEQQKAMGNALTCFRLGDLFSRLLLRLLLLLLEQLLLRLRWRGRRWLEGLLKQLVRRLLGQLLGQLLGLLPLLAHLAANRPTIWRKCLRLLHWKLLLQLLTLHARWDHYA